MATTGHEPGSPPGTADRCADLTGSRALRRLPIAFGWLTKRGDAATGRWMKPVLTQPGIRRDAVQVLRAIAADSNLLLEAAEFLPGCDPPPWWSEHVKTA